MFTSTASYSGEASKALCNRLMKTWFIRTIRSLFPGILLNLGFSAKKMALLLKSGLGFSVGLLSPLKNREFGQKWGGFPLFPGVVSP
jgi:hypothetical protein